MLPRSWRQFGAGRVESRGTWELRTSYVPRPMYTVSKPEPGISSCPKSQESHTKRAAVFLKLALTWLIWILSMRCQWHLHGTKEHPHKFAYILHISGWTSGTLVLCTRLLKRRSQKRWTPPARSRSPPPSTTSGRPNGAPRALGAFKGAGKAALVASVTRPKSKVLRVREVP